MVLYFWKVLVRLLIYLLFFCWGNVYAQQGLVHVALTDFVKDERFDKMINPIAFYETKGDTILATDPEDIRPPQTILISRPEGFLNYAYGFVYFKGSPDKLNPGMMALLLVDYTEKQPRLFADHNGNYDFTDDGDALLLPGPWRFKDSAVLALRRSDRPDAGINILLTRINFMNKYAYRDMLEEYYETSAGMRKFIGIENCFREQRYVTRSGVFANEGDTFRMALCDINGNGLYHDKDTDRLIIAGMQDSVFDTRDELHAFTLSDKKPDQYVERNGIQYEILRIDPAGRYINLRKSESSQQFDKIPAGKKVPRFSFYDWDGKKYKINRFRKKEVFIYYTGLYNKNFKQDTLLLREISHRFGDRIQIIVFLDVKKSYELKIFGTYSNLNWIAAFKDKYAIQAIKLRGLPSGLWLGKKRKVKAYNITPQQLLEYLNQSPTP